MRHKPNYEEIDRLEHECFPEWFKDETTGQTEPGELKPKPGRKRKVSDPGAVRQFQRQVEHQMFYGSAAPASAFGPFVSLASLHPGVPLRPMRRQVVLPWD